MVQIKVAYGCQKWSRKFFYEVMCKSSRERQSFVIPNFCMVMDYQESFKEKKVANSHFDYFIKVLMSEDLLVENGKPLHPDA